MAGRLVLPTVVRGQMYDGIEAREGRKHGLEGRFVDVMKRDRFGRFPQRIHLRRGTLHAMHAPAIANQSARYMATEKPRHARDENVFHNSIPSKFSGSRGV